MDSSVDAALGRVALVLRSIGAVWMIVLVAVYGLADDLNRPDVAVYVTALGVMWAVIAWSSRWMRNPRGPTDWLLLAVDLGVAVSVVLISAAVQEDVGYVGGYPFASLVVGLAAAGRRGVIVAAGTLSLATLGALAIGGVGLGAFVVGQILLYVLGAVALSMGTDVLRSNERRARKAEAALVVAEERASTAAHLHDSVLQTLALVQRRAEDPARVRILARRQERELREWLFPAGMSAPSSLVAVAEDSVLVPGDRTLVDAVSENQGEADQVTLRTALETAAEDVEAEYGVGMKVIAVGAAGRLPVPTSSRSAIGALVMAAREAMVNAAKHAGVDVVDTFVELGPSGTPGSSAGQEQIVVYVRDRGVGYSPQRIPADRHGVRGSIIDRMARAGGTTDIKTGPNRGTEVLLRLPLARAMAGGAARTTKKEKR